MRGLRPVQPCSLVLLVVWFVITFPVPASTQTQSASLPDVTCSPSPCRLPNVRVSQGSRTTSTASNLAINPKDPQQMVVGVADKTCPASGGAYSTSDGGKTWTRSCLQQVDPIYVDSVPSLAYDTFGIVHALTTLQNQDDGESPTYESHSIDNGQSWTPLTLAAPAPLYSLSTLDDTISDNSASSPYAGTVYASVTQYLGSLAVKITVSRSGDGGKTWRMTQAANLDNTSGLFTEGFSHLAVNGDGTLYLVGMATPDSSSPNKMLFVKSIDGGVSWSRPVLVYGATSVNHLPNTSIFVKNSPAIAVDNSGGAFAGRLYVAFYNFNGAFMQVLVTHSDDGGATWTPPVPVAPESDIHDQYLPRISVAPSGLLAVTWLDRRDDPENVLYRPYLALSRDGGDSWVLDTPLAKTLSEPYYGENAPVHSWAGSTLFAIWPSRKSGGPLQEVLGGFVAQE